MAQRELKVVLVAMHIEPTLHTKLLEMLDADADTASTALRGLLIKELQRRGSLSTEDVSRLVGANR